MTIRRKRIEVTYADDFVGTAVFDGNDFDFQIVCGCLLITFEGLPCDAYAVGVWRSVETDSIVIDQGESGGEGG
jgi:hypothetical protein